MLKANFPKFINDPVKIMWFEIDEAVIMFLAIIIGILGSWLLFITVPIGWFLVKRYKKFKRGKPLNIISHAVWFYWGKFPASPMRVPISCKNRVVEKKL